MADLVGGAALGLAFTELWKTVKQVKDHVKDFKPQLVELERTLRMLDPVVQDIERTSTQPNDEVVERLKSIMVDGKKLVSKCHGVRRDFFMKAYRRRKLVELDNTLIRFNIKYLQPSTFREVRFACLEQSSGFSRISDQIESLRPSAASDAVGSGGPIHSRPPIPPPLPNRAPTSLEPLPPPNNRAPSIDTLGRMPFVILPSIYVILKITAMVIIIYKAVTSIISILEKSESKICMVTKDVGELETTIELLDATMNSLVPVLEQIETNEADPSEDAERLRSLLEEGEKLVRDSSNIGWWNFVKKWQCQNKMVELDNKLLRFHRLYLLAGLAKNSDDDSEMKDQESFEPSAHCDQDLYEIKVRHMDTIEYEWYDMLNDNPHQTLPFQLTLELKSPNLCYKKPPISTHIRVEVTKLVLQKTSHFSSILIVAEDLLCLSLTWTDLCSPVDFNITFGGSNEIKGRHMDTREDESYDMLNDNLHESLPFQLTLELKSPNLATKSLPFQVQLEGFNSMHWDVNTYLRLFFNFRVLSLFS